LFYAETKQCHRPEGGNYQLSTKSTAMRGGNLHQRSAYAAERELCERGAGVALH